MIRPVILSLGRIIFTFIVHFTMALPYIASCNLIDVIIPLAIPFMALHVFLLLTVIILHVTAVYM